MTAAAPDPAAALGIRLSREDVTRLGQTVAGLAAMTGLLTGFVPPAPPDLPQPIIAPLTGNESIASQFARIESQAPALNCFTRLLRDRAFVPAMEGPLAGATFAVKDLFDVAGLPTTAGSRLLADAPPAKDDAPVVRRLVDAGATLVATCNMDEFAYGFVTVNAHSGTTRNPHDLSRLAGGSSGGSAAAVAAGLVRFSLGSDTNGSIRVPAALCGIYGLRPTHGRVPVEGTFAFVEMLDAVGPFAASLADLKSVYEVMAATTVEAPPVERLRIARLDGWFRQNADPALLAGIDAIAAHLDNTSFFSWPQAERARASAFVLTAAEGGARHLAALQKNADIFDPATRVRLAAGATLPAGAIIAAHRFRNWFRAAMAVLWQEVDVLIAPCAPTVAPPIDDDTIMVDGKMVSARANLGIFTQPVSLAGCPVLAVPLKRPGALPLGIQLIAAPGREDALFALAARLEADGLIGATSPKAL